MRFGSRGPSEFATEMPWRSHTFAIEKKNKFPERAAEMEMGLGLHQKGALPNVRTEPN